MVTDEILELLNRMIDLTDGTAFAQGIEAAYRALADFDVDKWNAMSEESKNRYVKKHIKEVILLSVDDVKNYSVTNIGKGN